MESFEVQLAENAVVTGLAFLPRHTTHTVQKSSRPLIVAIHGATYSASYFFADAQHSALPLASALDIPFLPIDRPGYQETTPLPPVPSGSTFLQEEERYLHQQILPAMWEKYASALGVSSMVLMTHSLGVPSGIVASALNAETRSYPLAGGGLQDLLKEKPATIAFPNDFKDIVMLGSREEGMADASTYDQTEVLQDVMLFDECADVQTQWLDYWQEYAAKVDVPVMYALAEKDWLWTVSEQHVRDFAGAFRESPRVECGLVLGTAHCMDLSRVAEAGTPGHSGLRWSVRSRWI